MISAPGLAATLAGRIPAAVLTRPADETVMTLLRSF
jgi:hypothetical protein